MIEVLLRLERTGALDVLDVELAHLAQQSDPQVGLAIALASCALREGHVCAELRALAGAPVRSEQGEETGVICPELDSWAETLQRCPLVASGLGCGQPLVLDAASRLYLARYPR